MPERPPPPNPPPVRCECHAVPWRECPDPNPEIRYTLMFGIVSVAFLGMVTYWAMQVADVGDRRAEPQASSKAAPCLESELRKHDRRQR